VPGNREGSHYHICTTRLVELQQATVINLLNIIAAQDQDARRIDALKYRGVVVPGIRRAPIPPALHWRREGPQVCVTLLAEARPALAQVVLQRQLLRKDEHPADVGVNTIAEGEVDQAIAAAEANGRYGAMDGEGQEARPLDVRLTIGCTQRRGRRVVPTYQFGEPVDDMATFPCR